MAGIKSLLNMHDEHTWSAYMTRTLDQHGSMTGMVISIQCQHLSLVGLVGIVNVFLSWYEAMWVICDPHVSNMQPACG